VLTLALLWALSAPTRAAGLAIELDVQQVSVPLVSDPDDVSTRGIESINDGTADQILTGSQEDERFGIYAMDSAGDVDGDGYVDVIVGSYRYDADGGIETFDGIAYIFPGSASGVGATPIVTLTIGQAEACFGNKVAGLGDVNGDGYPDIAVSAYNFDAPTNNEGAVFVYYGSESGIGDTPSITLTGVATTTYLGVGLAGAGDVNGDGYADLIVAAHGYDNGEENEGAIFVYQGSAMGLSATPAVTIENNIAGAMLKIVAGAGDVNGDGYADVVIGSNEYNSQDGIAYVHHGSVAGINPTPAVTLTTAQAGDLFATDVAGAGDVNGDGYADVVIGAQNFTNGEVDEGAFFVYHGSAVGISATPVVTVESDLENARLGKAVAGVGDVDGDGYGDLLAGARVYDQPYNDAGAAFLYHGTADGIDAANAVWLSPVSGGQYGYNVARAGDVNADGYADIMVAQDYYHDPVSRAGGVYIYHGGGDDLQSPAAWTATGGSNGTFFGRVASAGDVNGDGFSDVIVGSYGYDDKTGRAYIYLGESDGLATTAAVTLTGEEAGSNFGAAATSAGDVNGDGYSDVLVGAGGYMTGTGRVYLYHGSAGGLIDTPALVFTGENEGDALARSAPAGDVNGDGYADVIISASNYPSAGGDGRVYLYLGSAGGLSATPALTLTGSGAERFGIDLDTAGDVNGDGYADVVVGASRYSGGLGAIYVYHGGADGLSATPAFTATGEGGDARFGVAVGTAGDVNGDGYSDVVVGAEYYYTSVYQEGWAYVFAGSETGLNSTPIFAESDAPQIFGHDVSAAGDVNGDGYDDILIGVPGYPNFSQRIGRILVYHGSATGPDGTPDFIATGETNNSRFGNSVGTAGDVNGDGFADIIVGAPNYPNDDDLGKVYLYSSEMGRPVLAGQIRGDGSNLPVLTWGLSHDADGFTAQINATDPRGRGYVGVEVEACPAGTPFGDESCANHVSQGWTMTGLAGAVLQETLTGLSEGAIYAWRSRVLYDSHSNPYGPWRRTFASSLKADLRVGELPEIVVVSPSDGVESVALVASVVITFSELIDAGTLEYTITPDPGGWMATWSDGDSVVTLSHDGFDSGTFYTVTVTAADDLVGYSLGNAPYEWSFKTTYTVYLPLALKN
jgi:hypothetical protein